MKRTTLAMLVLMVMVPLTAQAQDKTTYGAFTALKLDTLVVEDVLVEGDNIYVKVLPNWRNATCTVRTSNQNMADYRKWNDGTFEMAVKVYQSQKSDKQGYTYRVNSTAAYVEYHLEGRLVLQLERMK
jgi:hypothetical protein